MANKYGAKKIEIDGHVFPSKREAEYYLTYRDMLARGEIINLELQPRFILIPAYTNHAGKKVRPCHYTADFLLTYPDGTQKVVEVKGFRTRDYLLRRKLFEWQYREYAFEEVR
jgi:hypothetical protein